MDEEMSVQAETQTETEVEAIETSSPSGTGDVSSREVLNDEYGTSLLTVYNGSFSSTYVEYFKGFVSKLPPDVHYLCFRDGQYSYVLYYSEDLEKEGSHVTGNADYYRLNTYDGYTLSTGSSDVSEDIRSGMYYSDFDGCASLLGGDYYALLSVLYALCIIFIFALLNVMYRFCKRLRKSF